MIAEKLDLALDYKSPKYLRFEQSNRFDNGLFKDNDGQYERTVAKSRSSEKVRRGKSSNCGEESLPPRPQM